MAAMTRPAEIPMVASATSAARLGWMACTWLAITASVTWAQLPTAGLHSMAFEDYALDFVSTAAIGVAVNDLGDVAGTSYPDTGCGSFCLPPLETVVWRGGNRIVLPAIPSLPGITVTGINNQGWVVGFAGLPGTTTHAVAWKPSGTTYEAIDLGTLPGTSISTAVAIDELSRVIGWSQTSGFPPSGSPFLWSATTGMVDLALLGYPDEPPVAMSRGGTVATASKWYVLGDPGSAVSLAPPPSGYGISGGPAAINDAGDQARFLVAVSGQNLSYLYRYHHEGTWQQLSSIGTGHLSRYGIGSISESSRRDRHHRQHRCDCRGPQGTAQPLASLLSPAYQQGGVLTGGPMNRAGEILAQVLVGRSPRLVRMTPDHPCRGRCLTVRDLVVRSDFVPDPGDPTHDHCYQDGSAYNETTVNLTIVDALGTPAADVLVMGRLLDDYWTNQPVSGMSNAFGLVTFTYKGPCGVGALAFFLDDATKDHLILDRGEGMLTGFAIPQ
ncbi:MAG: hypothetical protein U1E76_18895 [Planctomycetota bacterium]